jgi:hypothetical protein
MRKSKDGPKKMERNSPKRSRKTTLGSGTKSHHDTSKRLVEESRHKEVPSELAQKVILDPRKKDVPVAVDHGMELHATIADTATSYPLSVRQANNLIEELDHCWISNPVVSDLIRDLVRWLNRFGSGV